MQFYEEMAVDNFETTRDEAWRQKTLATFKECFGDLEKLELEWRTYMRKLRTDVEVLAAKM